LLQIVDEWITGVQDEVFDDVLPLLRRTFSLFGPPERREIGEQISRVDDLRQAANTMTLDLADAGPAIRTMARYLGWKEES
jgi:hypothetical protein